MSTVKIVGEQVKRVENVLHLVTTYTVNGQNFEYSSEIIDYHHYLMQTNLGDKKKIGASTLKFIRDYVDKYPDKHRILTN